MDDATVVHRRAPRPVGAPGLVWRLGIRHNCPPGFDAKADAVREGFEKSVQAFIDLNYEKLNVPINKQQRLYGPENHRSDKRRKSGFVSLEMNYRGAILKLVFDRSSEFVTITVLLDLSKGPEDNPTPSDPERSAGKTPPQLFRWPETLDKEVESIRDLFRCMKTTLDQHESSGSEAASQAVGSTEGETLSVRDFDRFWSFVWEDFGFEQLFKEQSRTALGETIGAELFADFRGVLILTNREDEFLTHGNARGGFNYNPGTTGFAPSDVQPLQRLKPLIDDEGRDGEVIACHMIRRRALYISSMGGSAFVPRENGPGFAPEARPMHYLVAVSGADKSGAPNPKAFDRWQIGRLIFRLNEAGTARIMALRDFDKIQAAGQRIQGLGITLNRIYSNLSLEDSGSFTREKYDPLRNEIAEFLIRVNGLNADTGNGGLLFRVNRSRIFAAQFWRLVNDLDIERVEGAQPYNEFVRRGLTNVYDGIDRILARIDSLYRRANTLLAFLDTRTEIDGLKQQNKLLHRITALQASADVLVPIAGGYYGGKVLENLVLAVGDLINFELVLNDGAKLLLFLVAGSFVVLMQKWAERKVETGKS